MSVVVKVDDRQAAALLEETMAKVEECVEIADRLVLLGFVERLRGRLVGRHDMNLRTSEALVERDPMGARDAAFRCQGIELAIMDLDYIAKEFEIVR